VYIRCFWLGNHQIYGRLRRIYTVLANPDRTQVARGPPANYRKYEIRNPEEGFWRLFAKNACNIDHKIAHIVCIWFWAGPSLCCDVMWCHICVCNVCVCVLRVSFTATVYGEHSPGGHHRHKTWSFCVYLATQDRWLELARTVYLHHIWPYVWWFPCQNYCLHMWFWPTL